MKTSEIRELIKLQRTANRALEDQLNGIKADKMISDLAKKTRSEEARTKHQEETTARGKNVADQLLAYKKGYKKGVDLSDPTLSNLLSIVNMLGPNTPRKVLDDVTIHFRDNQETLKTISDILKAKEIPYGTIEKFIIDDEAIDSAILEAQKGFGNVSDLSAVGIAMSVIESAESAQIAPEPIQPSGIPTLF